MKRKGQQMAEGAHLKGICWKRNPSRCYGLQTGIKKTIPVEQFLKIPLLFSKKERSRSCYRLSDSLVLSPPKDERRRCGSFWLRLTSTQLYDYKRLRPSVHRSVVFCEDFGRAGSDTDADVVRNNSRR